MGTILHSGDGNRWQEAGGAVGSEWLEAVAWSGDRFVAVGSNGTILHSSGGDRWSEASDGLTVEHSGGRRLGRRSVRGGRVERHDPAQQGR